MHLARVRIAFRISTHVYVPYTAMHSMHVLELWLAVEVLGHVKQSKVSKKEEVRRARCWLYSLSVICADAGVHVLSRWQRESKRHELGTAVCVQSYSDCSIPLHASSYF